MTVSVTAYLVLVTALFILGLAGLLLKRSILVMFMSIELMLNSVNLLFVVFARYHQNIDGQIVVLFVVLLAACEAAIGLAFILNYFSNFRTLDPSLSKARLSNNLKH